MPNYFESLRNIGASSEGSYIKMNIGENSYNGRKDVGETLRSTYSLLKQDPELSWNATGTSPNVTNDVLNSMNDPNKYMIIENRKFCYHSAVGKLKAYNELGNPSGGCWTFHMIG